MDPLRLTITFLMYKGPSLCAYFTHEARPWLDVCMTDEPGGVTCYLCIRANHGPRLGFIFIVMWVGATSWHGIIRSMALYHTCKFI
jgi:hypothetical protein